MNDLLPKNPPVDSMIAIVIEGGSGAASALKPTRVAIPQPKAGELLIKVHAAGVNRPDIMQRMGKYPPPTGASDTLGLEVAGEVVVAAGRWQVGDRVCALLGGGGYAQFALCDPRHALPIPDGLDFTEAASLPETIFTVYANVFEHGGLKPGETFLVHGATSGIGVTAIQMAKATGAKVIATARGAEKARCALATGADIAVDTNVEDFGAIAKREGGVDVVLDMVGGDYFAKELDALKRHGRIVFIANQGSAEVALPIVAVMLKQATITGSTMRGRDADEKARLASEIERVVWPWILSGRIKPSIDRTFSLEEAALAHQHLEGGSHVGKVVLTID